MRASLSVHQSPCRPGIINQVRHRFWEFHPVTFFHPAPFSTDHTAAKPRFDSCISNSFRIVVKPGLTCQLHERNRLNGKQMMLQDGHLLAVLTRCTRHAGRRLLKDAGIPILLIQAPRKLKTDCGMAIRFYPAELAVVENVLSSRSLMPEYISCYENRHSRLSGNRKKHKDTP